MSARFLDVRESPPEASGQERTVPLWIPGEYFYYLREYPWGILSG
jgi:hypothetical protein